MYAGPDCQEARRIAVAAEIGAEAHLVDYARLAEVRRGAEGLLATCARIDPRAQQIKSALGTSQDARELEDHRVVRRPVVRGGIERIELDSTVDAHRQGLPLSGLDNTFETGLAEVRHRRY